MLKKVKKELYFLKMKLLISQGLNNGSIVPFEDVLYENLSKVYFNGYPLSLQIKYLKPTIPPGQCEDRSWFITMAFEDALWVSGDVKDLELKYGKDGAWHFWVEHDGWVYDPSSLYKFKKELYYKIFMPTNVIVRTPDVYKKHEWYQSVVNTKIDDLRPGGKERCHLCVSIPLIQGIADVSGNKDFIDELDKHLKDIEYDYEQIRDDLDQSTDDLIRRRT